MNQSLNEESAMVQLGAEYLMEFAEIATDNEQKRIVDADEAFRKVSVLPDKEHGNMKMKKIAGKNKTEKKNVLFPVKLHELLCHSSTDNSLISWNPEGTFFIVHDPLRFSEEITPNTFRTSTYSSFTRQLKIYDFKRVADMEYFKDQAYYHELFLRAKPELCRKMKRISVMKNKRGFKEKENKKNYPCDLVRSGKSKRKSFESLEVSSISSNETLADEIMYGVCNDQNQNQNLSQYLQELNSLKTLNKNIESLLLLSHCRRKLLDSSYLRLNIQRMNSSFPIMKHVALQRFSQPCFLR